MKLAFVHCRIAPWGALKVLQDLIFEETQKHPHAQIRIFTLVSDRKKLKDSPITTVFPSRLNQIIIKYFDYRNLIIFAPRLMKILSYKIKKFQPDQILISSFAIAKNITIPLPVKGGVGGGFVSLYLHSPMQYIRSHYDEYKQKLRWRKGRLFRKITPRLRRWDKKYTKFDEVFANSHYTARLAKEIYGIDTTVKYPLVSLDKGKGALWDRDLKFPSEGGKGGLFYVYTGRLVRFVKEVDKIIQLFNHTGDPLIIIGSGPDEIYLKSIAHPNIIFIDRIDNPEEMTKILAQAKGCINLTKESFWLSTVEALLLGIPVFGYNDGATPELVDQDSWILVDQKDMHTLEKKFNEFKSKTRNREKIIQNIRKKLWI